MYGYGFGCGTGSKNLKGKDSLNIRLNGDNIYFCSDPHYGHKSLVRGETNWENKVNCRGFGTLQEHNKALVDNINDTVKNGTLFCLGDWSFGNKHLVREFRDKLDVGELHLILGNHDEHIRNSKELRSMFDSVNDYLELQVSEPSGVKGVKSFKQHIVLCHYGLRVWNRAYKGAWMLYGHSHGTLDNMTPQMANPQWMGDQYYVKNYKTMDVGFDTHNGFRPYSYIELKKLMESKDMLMDINQKTV